MQQITPMRFIHWYHRWTGLILIPLLTLKILSGFAAAGQCSIMSAEWAYRLHFAAWIDIPLLLGFIFHALYGVYKIIRPQNSLRVPLFYLFSVVALLLFAIMIIFLYFV